MVIDMKKAEHDTAQLFEKLFPAYDNSSFDHSMRLFAKRFAANNFPLEWFSGKKCLDVGCGGGRYTMAMARLGAEMCVGVDIGELSIIDARRRAEERNLKNVRFEVLSATNLPFEDETFDCVIFSGVLQHLANPITVLNEISRVLAPGGMVYLLVYATEGLRWPLIQMLRPIAQRIGFELMDQAVVSSGLSVAKRRTYLDDLFVPYIDFYSWACLENLLVDKSFTNIKRWENGRFDHEEDLASYLADLEGLASLFAAAAVSLQGKGVVCEQLVEEGRRLCFTVTDYIRNIIAAVDKGAMDEDEAKKVIIGQGHHRITAWKL